jgi:uncharacterized protein YnzC (UPF0291/DUF896 family)
MKSQKHHETYPQIMPITQMLERMIYLLEKAKTGELSTEEAETLEHYRHVGKLLELMKSRARPSLHASAPS